MTQESGRAVVSVRGEARRTVPPDTVSLTAAVTVTRTDRGEALRDAGEVLAGLTSRLAALGGTVLTPETRLGPVTWSAQTSVRLEREHDPRTGRVAVTGQVSATAFVRVTVRDFDVLLAVADVLAGTETLEFHSAGWDTDPDHPAWPELRAEAVHAALDRARQYAAALGGTVVGVEHLGDPGLVGGYATGMVHAGRAMMASGGGVDGLTLDPVPQELVAAVDARVVVAGLSVGPG